MCEAWQVGESEEQGLWDDKRLGCVRCQLSCATSKPVGIPDETGHLILAHFDDDQET